MLHELPGSQVTVYHVHHRKLGEHILAQKFIVISIVLDCIVIPVCTEGALHDFVETLLFKPGVLNCSRTSWLSLLTNPMCASLTENEACHLQLTSVALSFSFFLGHG